MTEMNQDLFQIQIADDTESEHIAAPQYSYWRSVFRKFFSSKLAIFMMILSGTVILLSIIQPMFSGYSPNVTPNINRPEMKYIRPNATYWFGTDDVSSTQSGREPAHRSSLHLSQPRSQPFSVSLSACGGVSPSVLTAS